MNDTMPLDAQPVRPARGLLKLNLRLSLVIVALLALWLARVTNRARLQAEVVATLREEGAVVEFDYEYPPRADIARAMRIPDAQPPGPAWLRRGLGDEYFRTIVAVAWWWPRPAERTSSGISNDELLRKLASLDGVKHLEIARRDVTDRAFATVARLETLTELQLWQCFELSDKVFATITRLPRLERLVLKECPITGRGLAALQNLPRLTTLYLEGDLFSDEGLSQLNALRGIEVLQLSCPNATDAGLSQLEMSNLRRLDLSNSKVTGSGLSFLERSTRLERLSFCCSMTDARVPPLSKLKKLTSLDVSLFGTALDDRTLAALHDLPALRDLSLGAFWGESAHFSDQALVDLLDSLPALEELWLPWEQITDALEAKIHRRHPKLHFGGHPTR